MCVMTCLTFLHYCISIIYFLIFEISTVIQKLKCLSDQNAVIKFSFNLKEAYWDSL